MEDLQESGNSIASSLADLSLVHQRLIKQCGGILLFLLCIAACFLSFGLLAGGSTGYVEPHLD